MGRTVESRKSGRGKRKKSFINTEEGLNIASRIRKRSRDAEVSTISNN